MAKDVNIEVVYFCPIDKVCEEIKDNKLYRCRWWKRLAGTHPQTGEAIDEWDCSIGWGPTLGVEVARTNRGQTQALESFRNETVQGGQTFMLALAAVGNEKKLMEGQENKTKLMPPGDDS